MDTIICFKNQLQRKKVQGLALDIDNTLSETNIYWIERLMIKFGNPDNLTVEMLQAKYRYASNIPFWQTEEGLKFMDQMRNDSLFQEQLPLIENSNLIVQKINKIIPVVAYITIRPSSVLVGTKNWLKKHRFPDAEVITKPPSIPFSKANQWKVKVLQLLYPQIEGIIDDNPEIVDYLPDSYKGTIYLYNINAAPKKNFKVIPCSDWNEVWQKFIFT